MSECWLWAGIVDSNDYGKVYIGSGKYARAHRVVYEALVGTIPDGLVIDHLCRIHRCVNPEHLEPVTGWENTLRGIGFASRNFRKTHCNRGHELSGDNLVAKKNSWRQCKKCHAINRMVYYYRKKNGLVKSYTR